MSKLSKIILSVFFLFLLNKNTLAIDFLECINDILLNKSIIEKKDSCFLFDSDIGRIVSVEAESTEESIQIEDFYKSILKQFGWILSSKDTSKDLVFVRDEEILKINIKKFLDKNLITYNSFLSLSIN